MRIEKAHLQLGGPFALRCFVSPNNPTGGRVAEEILRVALAQDGMVFVDEAYADFACDSFLSWTGSHSNLLCARSLSKSLLAGWRLGYAVGHPEVVAACEQLLLAPYHLTTAQLVLAEHFADIRPHVAQAAQTILAERDRVARELRHRSPTVYPSEANFLLFEEPRAGDVATELLSHGVRIRDVSGLPGLGSHLRVTIGTPVENDLFLEALAKIE
jgi:histidinol-phosphate aminotransferase